MAAKRLVVHTAFGGSLASTLLLAAHPDESHDPAGSPIARRRTLLLRIVGDRAVLAEELPVALMRSWYSASGVAYCGSVDSGAIHKWQAGRWTPETFSATPVDVIRYIYAFPGAAPDKDVVFLATPRHLHVRQGGAWRHERVPGEGLPWQMEGSRPDQVFVGGPELCVWNGTSLEPLESPRDDSLTGLAISADDRLIGGRRYISASTPDGGWERIKTPIKGFTAFARLGEIVYALSYDHGVVRAYPGPVRSLTRPLESTGLVAVGDGLVAFGDDGVLVFDGKSWTEVQLPVCDVGQRPA